MGHTGEPRARRWDIRREVEAKTRRVGVRPTQVTPSSPQKQPGCSGQPRGEEDEAPVSDALPRCSVSLPSSPCPPAHSQCPGL